MVKMRNIDNTYTYIQTYLYTYNKIHTHLCKLRNINNAKG